MEVSNKVNHWLSFARVVSVLVTVTVRPRPQELHARICDAITKLFPDHTGTYSEPQTFPVIAEANDIVHQTKDVSFFIERMQQQRILDTAMDIMALKSDGTSTSFRLGLAAAEAGKVSFVLPNDPTPPGNEMTVIIKGTELDHWIEEKTWHEGRRRHPRHIGDERTLD